jgi:TRAP-type uncharacterized transport system substrate-binding protein
MSIQQIPRRLPLWLRWTLTAGLSLIAAAAALGAYRYLVRPATLSIAAATDQGQTIQVLNALAVKASERSGGPKLKVVPTKSMIEAARLFADRKVDLAVLRADVGGQGDARSVVIVAQSVVLVLLPRGSHAEDFDGLKGKTIGVLDGELNGRIVDVIAESYGFDRASFKSLGMEDAKASLRARRIQALIVVMPLTERMLAGLRGAFDLKSKARPGVLAIDLAAAIASGARYLESHELPKGTLSGSPPLPDEDLTTLQVPINVVAQRTLDEDTVTGLTRLFMDAKGELSGKFPALAQVRAPETEKDAFIPLHPGAAAYYEGNEKTFFDRYGDALFYVPMLLGALASVLAAIWRFLGLGVSYAADDPVISLASLFPRVRAAPHLGTLDAIEDEIDAIVEAQLSAPSGAAGEGSRQDLGLAVSRLERAITHRRSVLDRVTLHREVAPPELAPALPAARTTADAHPSGERLASTCSRPPAP